MSNDTVMTVTVKGIGDFSDVVSNVGSVQKALTKLKLPDKIGDNLSKNITSFYKEYEKYQKKISEGIKTQGDYNQVEKSLNNMRNLYQAIGKDAQKLTQLDMKDMLNLDTGEFKKIMDEMTSVMKQIGSVKIDTTPFTKAFKDIQGVTKNSKITGDNGLLNQIIGSINTGQIAEAKKQLQELQNYAKKVAPRTTADGKQAPGTLSPEKYQQLTSAIDSMNGAVAKAEVAINPLIEKHNNLQKELDETKQKAAQNIKNEFKGYNQASSEVEKLTDSLRHMHEEEFNFNREAQNIDRQIQSYFGLSQMIRKVGDIARDAFTTVKELDKAMTETAVVTNFSVGDMWDMLPTYTQQANQLGSTIRDVYEAATLYYQQGLNTNQAMSLANETLKMARIAGLDAAEATNMMTAALRGFNMEINQQSAQKINDIYSELAAITASDTKEIGSAMERTASIANSANMEFATTSAFLAQMIETTREAPENLGTAMKTIVARFQEMKQDPTKLVDSEGVAMDANKVDKALKTIGVNLMNTKGEFRDLDDVFLDISQRWDSLTQGQQRYIATIAAGSRQQSRFIAMMSNYERTMELVDAANNSAGASQRQFEKTLDSMEAKLNKLKNAWDQFTMGLMNNQILKFSVDALTEGFTIVNKFIDILGRIPPKPFEGVTKSVLTLATTLGMLNFGKKASRGLVMGGAAWWKGEEGGFTKNFAKGFKGGSAEAQGMGRQAGVTWTQAVGKAINSSSGTIKGAMHDAFNMQDAGSADLIRNNFTQILRQIQTDSNNFGMGLEGEGAKAGEALVQGLISEVESGQQSLRSALQDAISASKLDLNIDDLLSDLQTASRAQLDPDKLSTGFEGLTKTASSAGDSIRDFGYALQGTPLEGFGNTLIRIGNVMDSMSRTAQTFGKNFSKAMEAAGNASGAGGKTTAFFSNMFPNLTKIVGLLGKIPPPILAIMAVLAVVGAIALKTAHDQKKALESATDAAAKASEAYDSAKQETSELADAIEQVKTNEDAFDGLVVGTAAFNEQLVTANDQILELIKKYPMLNDYLTTDKNGLMHISDEGLNAVKEYQKQRQANASALNLIQAADLNSVEAQQKADQMRKTKGTDTLESLAQRRKEADLVEQQAEAQQQMAKLNAVNTALVNKEIGNREKVSAILADQYDARREAISLEGESIHDLKQEYADFYGYKYDKSTKKLTDIEGNEIDVSDDTIKDAVKDIRVITDIEVDASSVESVLHSLDRDFSKTLGDSFENSSTFISDILSNNAEINEDLLEQVLDNPDQLNDFVEGLSAKEIAAVLGASEEVVESNIDGYKQQLEDKLLTNARNIIDTNAQANGELAAMLAQAQGKTTSDVLNSKEIQNNLMQQVKDFTSEQRNTLLNIGKTLETSVGSEAMATFVDGLSDIYQTGNEKLITTAQNWADSVNWDSAIGRLEGYNEAINMTADDTNHLGEESVKQINNLGQALLDSRDEANLLGEAFTEFYNSTDFQDMAENMDKFVDSSGQLNAASIMDMAEECGSLNNLLDTGAISAGGVAAALNALGSDGDLVLSDLNSKVLELLSNFGQLDGIIASSHRSIENFDWGIDTGESADFVKESAEKWNELYNGGEVGNPQLEAYAKYVLGEEKYIALLASHSGDLQATMDDVSKYVNEYADGFDKAWDSLANGSWQGKVPKELQDLNISFGYDENGNWEWDPGSATTEQLSEWLQAVKGIGPEMAAAMIEDWQNYSPNFRAERQKNDFQAGLDSYIEQRKGANGEIAITASELQTIASSTGQDIEEVRAAIAERAGIEANQIEVLENIDKNTGEYVTDGAVLNKELSQTLGANGQNGWLAKYQATDSNGDPMKNTIDLGNAIAGAVERGYTQAQATSMAYESYTNAEQQGKDYYYKGELIEAGQYKSLDDFAARLAEIDQNEQWVTIGQTMADAWIARIDEHENGTDSESDKSSADKPDSDSTKSTGNKNNEETGSPRHVNMAESERRRAEQESSKDERSFWQKFNDWVKQGEENRTKNMNDANSGAEERTKNQNDFWHDFWKGSTPEGHTELTPAQYQKMYGGSNSDVTKDKADESNNNLQEATSKLQEGGTQIETAATKLDTGAAKIESAATKLETAASNLSKPEELNSKNSTIPKGSTIPGAGFVESGAQSVNGGINIETSDADAKITILQTKLKNLNDLVNQGGTYKLKVSGLSDIKSAATAARTLTKNSGTKTIGVKTGKADMSSVKDATKTIGNTEAKIKVGATVDAAIAAARRARRTIGGMSATIDVEAHVRKTGISSITIDGKTVTIDTAASGKHNHGYAPAPSFGSAARGRYGQVGPKGKGGLTLTGELGYEVAWLPDENRSMVLGANGPQMINLPGNAVVWDHEQSKKILKQKAIPAGSHSDSTRPGRNPVVGGGGGGAGKKDKNKGGTDKQNKKNADNAAKVIKKAGNVNAWWWNMGKKVESLQRKIDKTLKEIQKTTKTIGKTLADVALEGDGYIQNLNRQITLNQRMQSKAQDKLNVLDKGPGKTSKEQKSINKAQKKVDDAEKKLAKAKKSKNQKEIKQAKKELKRAKKNLSKKQNTANYSTVSYDVTTVKKDKKGKKTKSKKTKKQKINLAPFVKLDKATGAYVVDYNKINSKDWDKSKKKAVMEAAEKKAEDYQKKRDTAEDNIQKAKDALEELSKQLYEEFYGWELQLTKIWNISQKIEETTGHIGRLSSYLDLLDAKVASGTIKEINTEFVSEYLQAFQDKMRAGVQKMQQQVESIELRKFELQDKLNINANDEAIANIGSRVSATEALQESINKAQIKADKKNDAYASKKSAKDSAKAARDAAKKEMETAKKKYGKNSKQYKKAKKDYDKAQAKYDKALDKFNTAKAARKTANKSLKELQSDYDKGIEAGTYYSETEQLANKGYVQELQDDKLIRELAREFTKFQTNDDGTVSVDFDTKAFIEARDAGRINGATAERLQTYVQSIVDQTNELNQMFEDTTQSLIEQEQILEQLKDDWAGYGEQLLSYVKEQQSKELDKIKKLTEAIDNSLKDLLDRVKQDLDRRRQQEDNTKTEKSISKKQQKLIILQANTAGGNQVEIARLQEEIAQDQQDYQRTLEDQLLDRLNKQADEATKQREKQIALQEAILQATNNAALVNKWMDNPEKYKAEIQKAFYDQAEYDSLTKAQQEKVERDFNKMYTGLLTNETSRLATEQSIADTQGILAEIRDSIAKLGKSSNNDDNDNDNDDDNKNKDNRDENKNEEGNKTEPIQNPEAKTWKEAYEKAKDKKNATWMQDSSSAASNYYSFLLNRGGKYAKGNKNWGVLDAKGLEKQLKRGQKIGYTEMQVLQDLANTDAFTWVDVIKAFVQLRGKDQAATALEAYFGTNPTDSRRKGWETVFKKKYPNHKKGGLADYTGPAWLDGTPSKPELVLNSTDTKNLIALKDILGKVMKGSLTTTTENQGDILYEININVDKIEKDYDVDKVVSKVKQEIVKSAGYRNVTQVRNFR